MRRPSRERLHELWFCRRAASLETGMRERWLVRWYPLTAEEWPEFDAPSDVGAHDSSTSGFARDDAERRLLLRRVSTQERRGVREQDAPGFPLSWRIRAPRRPQ